VDGEKVKLVRVDLQGKDEKLFVVNRTLDALKLEGAEAKKIDLAGGIAKVDLNEAILSGMGSMEEGTLLKALQMALGQFKEVELFQVTIDGKPVESLGGHLEWYDPQPVIRPAGSAAATQP
jgi:nitrous oxidase accessory protein NosD